MTERAVLTIKELREAAGLEVGVSDWRLVDQARIDAFADTTDDHQWVHVDPERAKGSPWRTTIAHGYLVLSLVPTLLDEILEVTDKVTGVNYGIDRVRFTSPVPSGSRIRLRAGIEDAKPRDDGVQYTLNLVVEVEGSTKPALVGEIIFLAFP
jgi:acyl dehydratase